jgi:hypothetical protein
MSSGRSESVRSVVTVYDYLPHAKARGDRRLQSAARACRFDWLSPVCPHWHARRPRPFHFGQCDRTDEGSVRDSGQSPVPGGQGLRAGCIDVVIDRDRRLQTGQRQFQRQGCEVIRPSNDGRPYQAHPSVKNGGAAWRGSTQGQLGHRRARLVETAQGHRLRQSLHFRWQSNWRAGTASPNSES